MNEDMVFDKHLYSYYHRNLYFREEFLKTVSENIFLYFP